MDYAKALARIDAKRRGAEFFEMASRMGPILLEMAELQPPAMHEKVVELAMLYVEVAAAWHDHSLVRSANRQYQSFVPNTPVKLAGTVEEQKDWQKLADLALSPVSPREEGGWDMIGPSLKIVDTESQEIEIEEPGPQVFDVQDTPISIEVGPKGKPGWPKGKPRKVPTE